VASPDDEHVVGLAHDASLGFAAVQRRTPESLSRALLLTRRDMLFATCSG
jgi:hypothetical protein